MGCDGKGYGIEARREIKRKRFEREGMIGTMGDKRLSEGRTWDEAKMKEGIKLGEERTRLQTRT